METGASRNSPSEPDSSVAAYHDDIRQLAQAIFRNRVRRAREMPGEEKLRAGFELFEFACGISRAGIKFQNPAADDAEVERILAERLALQRRLEIGRWKPTT